MRYDIHLSIEYQYNITLGTHFTCWHNTCISNSLLDFKNCGNYTVYCTFILYTFLYYCHNICIVYNIINFHFLKKNNFSFSKINDFFLPYGTVTEFNENKYILCNLGDAQKIFVRDKKLYGYFFFYSMK
jgi:hypothetical protein